MFFSRWETFGSKLIKHLTKRTGKTPCVIVVFDQKMFAETIGLCHSSHLPGLGSCFGENVDEKNRTYVF